MTDWYFAGTLDETFWAQVGEQRFANRLGLFDFQPVEFFRNGLMLDCLQHNSLPRFTIRIFGSHHAESVATSRCSAAVRDLSAISSRRATAR